MESLAAPLSVLEIVRTLIALAAFLFLPGWLFVSAWLERRHHKKRVALIEKIASSVFASIVFLSLITTALAFTIGANFFSILGCELILIAGLWLLWKNKK